METAGNTVNEIVPLFGRPVVGGPVLGGLPFSTMSPKRLVTRHGPSQVPFLSGTTLPTSRVTVYLFRASQCAEIHLHLVLFKQTVGDLDGEV
jgi:hypothetical protein